MSDYIDYTIGDNGYQGNGNGHHGNGYDKLVGDYAVFYKVAKGFTHRVKREDREDILHDLILAMARVKATYDAKGKELTEGGLVRIAQYGVADYWRRWYHRNQNHDCGRCSQRQRERCNEDNSYGSKCPKAIQLESLDTLVEDGDGDSTPLYELIADDDADFIPRLDARLILESYPRRFVQLAYKKYAGYRLTDSEAHYYWRERKKAQKKLVEVS
jgi:hypothetical protein